MSNKDFTDLYIRCYPGVKNEMVMRANSDDLNGRFARDDQVVEGALHSFAWVIFTKEDNILYFPETYGRVVTVTMYDMWNNVRAIFNRSGQYLLSIPNAAAGILIASVECKNASDEQEYQMAFDVLQDLYIMDIGVGTNDYEDSLTLVPDAGDLTRENPEEISGKEFFAIASAVHRYNPFPVQNLKYRDLLQKTMTMSGPQLDVIKKLALAKMKN